MSETFMYFETYPVRRNRDKPKEDNLGRLLPNLPTQRIPTPQYQYRTHSVLELQPHAAVPLDGKGPLTVKITKPIRFGFGFLNQVFCCQVVKGPKSLLGRELVALAYDSLYVETFDLRVVHQGMTKWYTFAELTVDDTVLKPSCASTLAASTLPRQGDGATKVISDISNSKPKSSHALFPEVSPKSGNKSASDISHTASRTTLASSVPSISSFASTLGKSNSPKSSVDELSTEIKDISLFRQTFVDDFSSSKSSVPANSPWTQSFKSGPFTGEIETVCISSKLMLMTRGLGSNFN